MNDLMIGIFLGFVTGVLLSAGVCLMVHRRGKRSHSAPASASVPMPSPLEEHAGTPLLEQLLAKTETAESLRQNLRVKFLYNEQKVDDAVDFERQRAPHATEEDLLRAANERWERENR